MVEPSVSSPPSSWSYPDEKDSHHDPSHHHDESSSSTIVPQPKPKPNPINRNQPVMHVHQSEVVKDFSSFLHYLETTLLLSQDPPPPPHYDDDHEMLSRHVEMLGDDHDHHHNDMDDIVVVLYAASFCSICQRASIVYKQIAHKIILNNQIMKEKEKENENEQGHPHSHLRRSLPQFYRLKVSAKDGPYMKPLHIHKFPFVEIFVRGDCVARFSTTTSGQGQSHSLSFRNIVTDTLHACIHRTTKDWSAVRTQFAQDIADHARIRKQLLQQIKNDDNYENERSKNATTTTTDYNN